jgi:hypothetical protein
MACTLTNIQLDCDLSGVGGIYKFYVAEADEITYATAPASGAVGLTSIELDGTAVTDLATNFQEFSGLRGTSQLNETLSMGDRGSTIYTQVLSGGFSKITKEKQEALRVLASKAKLCVIALDYNNQYFLVGNEHGAYLSAANNASGLNAGDQNGLQIEITGVSGNPMLEVTTA